MGRKIIAYILMCVCALFEVTAQELNCRITVSADQIEGTNKDVFTTLNNDLMDFMNSRRWTDAVFETNEKIDCSFTLVLESVAGDTYSGNLSITATRPVYNSSYTTTLFNFRDKDFKFSYVEFDKLEFSETDFTNNLMSIMAYYAYVVIGQYFDSFQRYGGTKYYEKAEQITSLARSASDDAGWKAFESDKNRYAIISSLLDANLSQLRDVNYEYHRLGLDEMAGSVEKGRAKIYSTLPYLKELRSNKPDAEPVKLFVEAKLQELVDMFAPTTSKEKKEVYDIIKYVLPTTQKAEGLLSN